MKKSEISERILPFKEIVKANNLLKEKACPSCGKPISTQKNAFYCPTCHTAGDIVTFVSLRDKLPLTSAALKLSVSQEEYDFILKLRKEESKKEAKERERFKAIPGTIKGYLFYIKKMEDDICEEISFADKGHLSISAADKIADRADLIYDVIGLYDMVKGRYMADGVSVPPIHKEFLPNYPIRVVKTKEEGERFALEAGYPVEDISPAITSYRGGYVVDPTVNLTVSYTGGIALFKKDIWKRKDKKTGVVKEVPVYLVLGKKDTLERYAESRKVSKDFISKISPFGINGVFQYNECRVEEVANIKAIPTPKKPFKRENKEDYLS